jgi:copper chaperone
MTVSTYRVEGMTCGHCVAAVQAEVGALPGVEDVEVSLVPDGLSTVAVTSQSPLDVAQVREAIDEAGYSLADSPA